MSETKITYRIPTEQFGFVEINEEVSPNSPLENVVSHYRELVNSFKPGEGLNEKDYNKFIDRQLNGEDGNHIDDYNQMSEMQRFAVQVIKKGIKRINKN